MLSMYFLIKEYKFNSNYAWLLILPLIFLSGPIFNLPLSDYFRKLFTGITFNETPFKIGATFIVLKSYVSLKQWIKRDKVLIIEALSALTFVPSLPAGPIHGCLEWENNKFKKQGTDYEIQNVLIAISRIFWGIASLMVIAPLLASVVPKDPNSFQQIVLGVYFRFISLFFDFSGYSSVAIGSAALFGIKLPENFDKPFLATNIKEFWRRWHMSMSNFIGTYIYKPYVRLSNNKRLGIFIAFIFAGLWHEVSLRFLLWGIGHGTCMAVTIKNSSKTKKYWLIHRILSYLLTFNIVTFLSAIATGYI